MYTGRFGSDGLVGVKSCLLKGGEAGVGTDAGYKKTKHDKETCPTDRTLDKFFTHELMEGANHEDGTGMLSRFAFFFFRSLFDFIFLSIS